MEKLPAVLKNVWNVVLIFAIYCTTNAPAWAVTFDELTEFQEHFANGNAGSNTAGSTVTSTSVIGGKRQLFVENVSSPIPVNRVETRIELGYLVYSEDSSVRGATVLTYNGNLTNTTTLTPGVYIPSNPTGLGGMDLTKDGGTKFVLRVTGYDYPFSTAMPITFRVFDASDSSGNKRSQYVYQLNQAVNPGTPLTVEIPFANFAAGPGGAADFTNVGAIQVIINGVSNDNDLTVEFVGTDGNCPTVPQIGLPIVDDCGDCNGTNIRMDDCGVCHPSTTDPNWNQSCLDCLSVPNGNAVPGTQCDTGNLGQCEDGTWDQNCVCIPDKNPETEICYDTIDNDCNGQTDENNSTCNDCKGVKNGTAQLDRCGVCEGDGTSCLGCNSYNQSAILRKLDGGAKQQERVVKRVRNIIVTLIPQDSPLHEDLKKLLKVAHEYQLRNWELSWMLPKVTTTCTNTTFCVTTSNVAILTEYRERNLALYKMGKKALGMLRKVRGGKLTRKDRKFQKLAKKLFNDNLERSKTVPELQFACT